MSGWTDTVRPSTSYTNLLKVQGIADYGYSDTNLADDEEDHLVPLELGGSPKDPGNLWPEPYSGTQTAHTKDGTDTKLKNAVCAGTAPHAGGDDRPGRLTVGLNASTSSFPDTIAARVRGVTHRSLERRTAGPRCPLWILIGASGGRRVSLR
ncbi:hypothetical protein [Amycolatopsis sp. FDAARGOS 1241]|uniref:hypothetical protein n=1 Tax=Amycolatopsis sp. FDAARGOS 1241 TaxID=2778070 RepID=UPI00194F0055|nr:hypothetical protein [Amycolatopsis sp. FDAARGOS 1241]QRP42960.1 hypothetical protein I6J71_26305 [Amycolatopsis sp. FDAARGOS 1241]